MTKVRISGTASDLCTAPAVAQVLQFHHGRLFNGLCESRPAAAALVLIRGGKERLAGDDIHIDALFKLIPELACEARSVPLSCVTRYCSAVSLSRMDSAAGF